MSIVKIVCLVTVYYSYSILIIRLSKHANLCGTSLVLPLVALKATVGNDAGGISWIIE